MSTTIYNREISPEKLAKIAQIFQGLAYPVRIQILELLEDGSTYSVSDILKKVQIEPSLLSHHLSKMKNIGILESHREGRFIFYKLAIKEISKVFDCIYSCELKI